jgi:RHS repeat-associated protein
LIEQDTTVTATGQTRSTKTSYDTFTAQACQVTNTGCGSFTATRMDPLSVGEYDYTGSLLRTTNYAYLHQSNQTYANLNIVDRVTQKTILDGGGNQLAQTTYEYDNYKHTGQPMVASGAVQHDTNFSTTYTTRGNVTAVSQWRNTDGALLTTTHQYDDAGNIISTIDPLKNKTLFDFTDSWSNVTCVPSGQGKAYATKITNALNQITSKTYNSCTASVASTTDSNTRTTSFSYDLLDRVTLASYPDGGSTSHCYTDIGGTTCSQSGPPYSVVTTKVISSTLNETSTEVFDGLGRLSQTQLNSDPSGADFTLITYDLNGRKYQVYNPTRCLPITTNCGETTWGFTTTNYDALDRITSVVEQDGSSVTTAYDQANTNSTGVCSTVTDEAGNSRQSCEDGLGRMTGVFEDPGSSPHLNYETDYTYNALDNLTNVNQKGSNVSNARTRAFSFDSLSELTSAQNPESGTIGYTYDADGNVITKTAPSPNQSSGGTKSVVTTYAYDQLNRLTSKKYVDGDTSNPATAPVTYGYDGVAPSGCTPPSVVTPYDSGIPVTPTNTIGRRSAMCDGSGTTAWIYDSMGRPTIEERTLNGVTKNVGYVYTLDGSEKYIWYPSDDRIAIDISTAGRVLGVEDQVTNDVFDNASYTPGGLLSSMDQFTRTSSYSVGFGTNYFYNQRLQRAGEYAGTGGTNSTILYKRCYDYHVMGGLSLRLGGSGITCTFTGTTPGDNGNVYELQNQLDDTRSQNFTYDSLNRMATAYTNGTNWGQSFTIDSWSNLTSVSSVSGKTPVGAFTATASTKNQLSCTAGCSSSYDAAGNMLTDGNGAITYDAENRILTAGGVTYTYDGDGKRVEKSNGTLYWTGVGSEALSESDLSGNINEEYIFFNGMRVSRIDRPSNTVHSFLVDHLGSSRMIVVASGTNTLTVEQDIDYTPYGVPASGTAADPHQFQGKEYDSESGLNNFGARYDAATLGRFMTPDWAGKPTTVPYAKFGDPQTLNLYSFVENGPINRIDPDGHCGDGKSPNGAGECVQKRNNEPAAQNQPKPGEAHKGEPTSLKPEGSTPVGNNGAKIFTYQVVDPTGRAVKDVSVQEHVRVVAAENVDIQANPNFVKYPTGQVRDQIGPLAPPTQNSFLKTEQTFTAMKGGNTYEMSTKVNQYVNVTNGNVTVQTVVIVP